MAEYKLTWVKKKFEQTLTWEELISGTCVAFGGQFPPEKIEKINK